VRGRLFITAGHIINNRPQNSEILYYELVPVKWFHEPVRVTILLNDLENDICLGAVEENEVVSVPLTDILPEIGTYICLCGYPRIDIKQFSNEHFETQNIRKYWQPTYIIDDFWISDEFWHGGYFMTLHTSLPGMDGGPVFNIEGKVCGVNVGTYTRRIVSHPPITVYNGIAAGVNMIKQILEKFEVFVK